MSWQQSSYLTAKTQLKQHNFFDYRMWNVKAPAERRLLRPQRDRGVNARRTPGRNPAGGRGDGRQQGDDAEVCGGVETRDPEQE